MKRYISLILAAIFLLALIGCTPAQDSGESTADTSLQDDTTADTTVLYPEADNPVTFFSLSLGEDYENIKYITVSPNGDGTVYVEYVGEVKKVGNLDENAFHGITAALESSGLVALNGQESWSDGEANGSMYIEFADGTCITAGFNGQIPDSYTQGYAAMDAFFAQLTRDIPVYVPQPAIMGAVDPMLLDELTAILSGSGIQNIDAFTISPVEKGEYFSYTLGLSSDAGIGAAASLAPMMMTTAYSLVIVSLEDGVNRQDIAEDFMQNLDWTKWVCVAPSHAMIAAKGNMVLCLMAADQLYAQTAAGVENAGWTVIKVLENR